MLEINERVVAQRGEAAADQLELCFELRQKRQLRGKLRTGRAVVLRLPRGPILRGGDLLRASDGTLIEIIAAPESLLRIKSANSINLARLAYHLGNRHVAVQVGDGVLHIAEDPVLENMLLALGANFTREVGPFEPEAGAYAHDQRHAVAGHGAGRIHDYFRDETAGHHD